MKHTTLWMHCWRPTKTKYADNLKLLLVTLGYANNHVVKKSSGESVKRTVLLLIIGTGNEELVTLLRDSKVRGEGVLKLAEGALYGNNVALSNGYGYTCGHSNGFSTNS